MEDFLSFKVKMKLLFKRKMRSHESLSLHIMHGLLKHYIFKT